MSRPDAIQTYPKYLDPKDAPAHIDPYEDWIRLSGNPGVVHEHRVVEFDRPRRRPRDPSPIRPRRPSGSPNPQRGGMVVANKGHHRRDYYSSSDSDYDTDGSSPHRVRSPRYYSKGALAAGAVPKYANPPGRSRSMGAPRTRSQGPPGPPRPPRRYDSDSDGDSSSDDNRGKKAQLKPPPKQILYTGLACIATIAAANNIYQSAKAHHTRQKELEEGEITSAEAEKMKIQSRKMDLISLGVAAVGAYNVRNGWRRAEGHWKAHKGL